MLFTPHVCHVIAWQVYEAYFSSAPMAVKVMNLEDGITPQALQNFKQEVDLQNQLSMHPNVVRFCGACADIPPATRLTKADGPGTSVTLAIVMELCRFGNLYKIIEQARRVARLPEPIRSRKAPCTLHQRELLVRACVLHVILCMQAACRAHACCMGSSACRLHVVRMRAACDPLHAG